MNVLLNSVVYSSPEVERCVQYAIFRIVYTVCTVCTVYIILCGSVCSMCVHTYVCMYLLV